MLIIFLNMFIKLVYMYVRTGYLALLATFTLLCVCNIVSLYGSLAILNVLPGSGALLSA